MAAPWPFLAQRTPLDMTRTLYEVGHVRMDNNSFNKLVKNANFLFLAHLALGSEK